MLANSTFYYFVLTLYSPLGGLRYLCFTLTALLYFLIIVLNLFLIFVICMNRSLHEPMYIFLCSLFVNELYISIGLLPHFLVQLLSDIHIISAPFCFLQIFCGFTYANVEFCNLAAMSYDRYLAICFPLQYNTLMTLNRAVVFIVVILFYAFAKSMITILMSVTLPLCGNVLNTLYCNNYLIVRLACSDTQANNIQGIIFVLISILVPLLPILFSYFKILKVCFSGSKQTRRKAVNTCTPHLTSLLNFSFGCMFEIVQSRFNMAGMPSTARIFLSLYFLLIQPLLNPLMYGLQLTKLQSTCKNVLRHKLMARCRGTVKLR